MYILARAGYNLALSFTALEYLANANLTTYHRIIWLAISVIAASHLSSILVLLLYCRPTEKAWMPTTEGRCFDIGPLLYGTSITTLTCNMIAVILPVYKLWSLQSSWALDSCLLCDTHMSNQGNAQTWRCIYVHHLGSGRGLRRGKCKPSGSYVTNSNNALLIRSVRLLPLRFLRCPLCSDSFRFLFLARALAP
jgi:hypothetical protein